MTKRQKIRKSMILISFFLFPATFYYMSPYLIIEASVQGVVNGSFIIFSILFISSLFSGRVFCGWVCPAGGVQETIIPINSQRIARGRMLKWVIWLPWMTTIIIAAFRAGGYDRVDFFYQTTRGLSIGNIQALITYMLVLLLIVTPTLTIGRRSFCHHICWMAPFMVIGRKVRNLVRLPSLQLNAENSKCIHCHACTNHCPMSLPVENMVKDNTMETTDCILCGTCIDVCKSKVFQYEYKRPST